MTIFSLLEQPQEHLDLQMLVIFFFTPQNNDAIC